MKNDESIHLIENILKANYVPVYRFELPCKDPDVLDKGLRSHVLGLKNTAQFFEDLFEKATPGKIYFNTDLFQCTFVIMLMPDKKSVFYCGPVLFEKIQGERFEELFSTLSLSEVYHDSLESYYQQLSFQASYAMFESLFLELGRILYGDECEIIYSNADFFDHWNNTYKNYLRNTEKPFSNIDMIEQRYESENILINAVTSGRESRALEMTAQFGIHFLPQRASNAIRDVKDYTIILNTLLRKAAERAGVHPIHIDSYSNCNIAMLEKLTTVEQCVAAQRKIVLGYCRIVKEHQPKVHSPLLRRVLAYIETDLGADLTLKSLSEHLGVNASYLSSLFSKEMGISLTDYVNNLRISHAKILLENTEVPIKSIALRCDIGDIHYFTRLFKRITNMTPKAYRQSHLNLTQEHPEDL